MAQLQNRLYILFPAYDAANKSSLYLKTYDYTDVPQIKELVSRLAEINDYLTRYEPCQRFYHKCNFHELLDPLKTFGREITKDYLTIETKLKSNIRKWKCLDSGDDTVQFFIGEAANSADCAIVDNDALSESADEVADEKGNSTTVIAGVPKALWEYFSQHRNPSRTFHVIPKHPVNTSSKLKSGYRSTMEVTETEAQQACHKAIGGASGTNDFYYYFKAKHLYIRFFNEGDIPQNTFHAYTFHDDDHEETGKIPTAVKRFLEVWGE